MLKLSKESQKTLFLTLIFFSIVGSYWFITLIKDAVFFKITFPVSMGWPEQYGRNMQPWAKMLSPLVILFLILIYSKLVDMTEKKNLFYILGIFFICSFSFVGSILAYNYIFPLQISKQLLALTGWFAYFISDAFGSLMTALFWSFAVSITTVEEAKSSFPKIIAGAQVGSILGSLSTAIVKKLNTVWPLYFLGCICILAIMLLVKIFTKKFNIHIEDKKDKVAQGIKGFFSGVTLLVKSKYLISIFAISTLYEIIVSMLDYRMKSFLDINPQFSGEVGFAMFQTIYGVSVNSFALLIALFGAQLLLKKLGPSFTVFVYPIFLGIGSAISLAYILSGGFNYDYILWFSLVVLAFSKGLTYGLNNPTRDIFYIPTSEEIKFKTKAFTETFGSRASLMTGSAINNLLKNNLYLLVLIGSTLSLGIVGIWMIAAIYASKKFKKLYKAA